MRWSSLLLQIGALMAYGKGVVPQIPLAHFRDVVFRQFTHPSQ